MGYAETHAQLYGLYIILFLNIYNKIPMIK